MKKFLNSLLIFGLASNIAVSASAWVKQPKQANKYNEKTEPQTNESDIKTQVDYVYNGHEYIGTNTRLFRSDKLGIQVASWYGVSTGDIVKIYGYNKVLYVVKKSPTGGDTLWYSTDNGLTWAQNTSIPSGTINKIYGYNNIVYVSVYNSVDYLYKSIDNGKSFTSVNWTNDVEINDIYGGKNNRLLVATNKGIYTSTDDAKTFIISQNNKVIKHFYAYNSYYIYASEYNPSNNQVYIGISDDSGESWSTFTNWPPNTIINDISFYSKFIYVASDDGIWFKKYNETGPTSWVQDGHNIIKKIVVNSQYIFESQMNTQGDWDGIYRGVVFPTIYKTVWHKMPVDQGVIRSMYVANDKFHFCQENYLASYIDKKIIKQHFTVK